VLHNQNQHSQHHYLALRSTNRESNSNRNSNNISSLATMTTTITVPDKYGYVILTCTVLPFMSNLWMAGQVMKAREKFKVFYPNLYATPGNSDNSVLRVIV
jgi:hypothetical protein